MKKLIFITLSAFSLVAAAQDTYLNNQTINTSDVFGTARFVGMGGAMGALGADISVISSNPAGLGLFTKNDMSLTAGAAWLGNNSAKGMADGTFAQFDQIGAVASYKISNSAIRTVNFAFNYQKKASYENSFYGETATAASWADQLRALRLFCFEDVWDGTFPTDPGVHTFNGTIYDLAGYTGLLKRNIRNEADNNIVKSPNDLSSTLQTTRGSLNAYELNVSTNISDRYFLGLTLGIDNVDYERYTDYWENRYDVNGKIQDFGYMNNQRVTGNGFNIKLGTIIRPFDSSTFRVGFTVETPTWYSLRYIDDQLLRTKYNWSGKKDDPSEYVEAKGKYYNYYVYDLTDSYINYLEYRLTSPWKVRAQMGSTVGTNFAWGMEYEFANYPGTSMKYPAGYGSYNQDEFMNSATAGILEAQHTLRAGVEFKPSKAFALRAGYNYITSTTRPDSEWDPYFSPTSLAYPTGLDYMNLSDVHILTLGAGFRYKWFYADLSYKYRSQCGEYYAFNPAYSDALDNNMMDNSTTMAPIPVSMDRHSIMATIGVRF